MARHASAVSGKASPARYVIMSRKIKPAMMPDSEETFPSQTGRAMKRRTARTEIEMATATANSAAKPK